MKEIYFQQKLRWLHFSNPTPADMETIREITGAHPIILDELMNPSDRVKTEQHAEYFFMVYHFPVYNTTERSSRRAEIDFVCTKDVLITVTKEDWEPVQQFEHEIENKKDEITSTAHLVYSLLETINEFSIRQLKHVEKKMTYVGERLFHHADHSLLAEISYIKRDILEFSMVAVPQRTLLDSLIDTGTLFWGTKYKPYFVDLAGDFLKVYYLLENLKGTIESYSQTVTQILELKTSEIVRRFSILGFLTFPLLLYSTIALQPRVEATIIQTPSDFWFQLGIIFLLVLAAALFFRKKGWF